MTDAERWTAVKALVSQGLDLEPAARAGWLAAQLMDEDLRREVHTLLEVEARAGTFLEGGALQQPGAAAAVHEATRTAVAVPIEPGQRLGAYRIDRAIGQGGMGVVFLAHRDDDAFDKQVAIKVVRPGFGGPDLVDRLREERRLLATLEHSNIARLLDGGATDDGVPYVVMEYVDGVPIDAYCEVHRLSVAARLALVRRVCEAVHHAHRNLVVHRDIKPSNILVTADGTPKLLDFGIAKVLDADTAARTLTGYGAMTPESASPEQVTGGAITVATDVYALGVLLYRLLTGVGPYAHATNAAALLRAVTDEDPLPPGRRAPGRAVAVDVDRIVLKAMAKRPHDRYDTAAALSDDLGRFLDGRPVLAAPDSLAYRTRRFVTRHRLGTAVAATGLIALTAGVTGIVWQARIAERQRQRAERRFDDVRRLANTLVFDIHDAVARLPGSTPVRKTIVESAVVYLDALAQDTVAEPQLRRELASGYERLARVQGSPGGPNLGDVDGARVTLEKARVIRQTLADVPTHTLEDTLALARNFERRATLARTPAERRARAADGLRLLDVLPEPVRERLDVLSTRATLVWDEAVAAADLKDYDTAAARYAEAAALFERQLTQGQSDPELDRSRNLAIALKNLGAVEWVRGNRDGAVTAYRRALALDEARLATRPDDPTWLLDVAFGVGSLAVSEFEMGHQPEAMPLFERSLTLRQKALAADPRNEQARAAVARASRSLAEALDVRGDHARARDVRAQGAAIDRPAAPPR